MAYNGTEGEMILRGEARMLMENYRNSNAFVENNSKEGILFGKDHIENILAQPGCKGVRIYYGKQGPLSTDDPQMIIVGTDIDGNDMSAGHVLDMGYPCPDICSSLSTKL